jgi:phosphatidate cytidylyltransferase
MKYHNLLCGFAWILGIVAFTLKLKHGLLGKQLYQFGFAHLVLIIIVFPASLIIINVFQGVVWMAVPCLLVICNDISAYIFGRAFGRHKLINLSPKKTWEGFIGGCFATMILAFMSGYILGGLEWFVCPAEKIELVPFKMVTCEIPSVFVSRIHDKSLIFDFLSIFGLNQVKTSEFSFHAVIFGLFGSLISPFGGFFASGVKRALGVKDFGSTIPGHGGFTDRFDCQILMVKLPSFFLKENHCLKIRDFSLFFTFSR